MCVRLAVGSENFLVFSVSSVCSVLFFGCLILSAVHLSPSYMSTYTLVYVYLCLCMCLYAVGVSTFSPLVRGVHLCVSVYKIGAH